MTNPTPENILLLLGGWEWREQTFRSQGNTYEADRLLENIQALKEHYKIREAA